MATQLQTLRDDVRIIADIENDTGRHPDAELTRFINRGMKELYIMAQRYGILRYEKTELITADGSASYNLAADYFGTMNVWLDKDDYSYRLQHMDMQTRPFEGPSTDGVGDFASHYRVTSDEDTWKIEFYPLPSSGTFRHTYLPKLTDLSGDTDTIPVFLDVMGWEDYIIKYAVREVFLKDDISAVAMKEELDRIEARVAEESELRNMTAAYRIHNARNRGYFDSGDVWDRYPGDFFYYWPGSGYGN